MHLTGVRPDAHSLSILLSTHPTINFIKQAHAYIVTNAFCGDPFLDTALVDTYLKSGAAVFEACKVFDELVNKSFFTWNAMISGFSHIGLWERSLEMFARMRREGGQPQAATFSSVLTACSAGDDVDSGEGIHCLVVKFGFELDPYVCTSLLTMYARCGLLDGACRVFHGASIRGVEVWNCMISAYVGKGCADEALCLYRQMRLADVRCDCITLSNVLSACGIMEVVDLGRAIHGELIKRPEFDDLAVQSSLMTMYMKSGSVTDAETLFSADTDWDIVAWGSMISGFAHNKKFDCALDLFSRLIGKGLKPDSAVIVSAASACAGLKWQKQGFLIHGHAIKSGMCFDVFAGSALIDMYAKCGLPQSAGSVLFEMPLLAKGKMIHGYQVRNGIVCDIHAENAMLDMYMKCGCPAYAQCLLKRMRIVNIVSWNTMISGFGSDGHCMEAIGLFEKMQRLEVIPDETTFLSLISSCSHSGLVEEGVKLFQTMTRDYGIVPRMEHYANMVDLLGRSGRLNEAYCFIKDMLTAPDESVWLCLLSACRAQQDTDIGEMVADHLMKLKPEGSGSYTQLLNFYGELGLVHKAASVKQQMREAGVKKNPGCSWIELKDRAEVFYSSDSSSHLTSNIHDTLRDLRSTMRDDEF